MKRAKLMVGQAYKTKVSGDWQIVTLVSLRDDVPEALHSLRPIEQKEVLVRTGAGNVIYRKASQLRLP